MLEKERSKDNFERNKNNCHSRVSLSGSSIAFNSTQGGDPRLQTSGMTANLNASSTWGERVECVSTGVRGKFVRGFTLIELLVVVLIIGILAAVALPQYQLTVEKSRFATLKNLTKSILGAQEIYYMEHGSYASYFKDLIIDMPGDKLETSTLKDYVYDWGSCMLNTRESDVYVVCTNDKMRLQAYPAHAPAHPNDIACMSKGPAADSVHAKICKQETGRADEGGENGGYRYWFYE